MNWKRGLFRVWALLAGLWVFLIVGMAFDEWRSYQAHNVSEANSGPIETVEPPGTAKPWLAVLMSSEYRKLSAASQKAASQQYFDQVIAPNLTPESVEISKAQFDREMAYDEMFALGAIDQRAWKFHAWFYVWLAVVPPALIFVLGLGALWTIAGFRSR
jgi:hypothetical protein